VNRAALGTVLLLWVAACASPPTFQPLPSDDPRRDFLISNWLEQVHQRSSMRGLARLAVDYDDGKTGHRSKQLIVLERPSKLRVEVFGLLNQSLAVLVTDGERFNVYRAEDRSLRSGIVHPGWLWREAGIALRPDEAVGVLLGAPIIDDTLVPTRARQDADGRIQIDLESAEGEIRQRVSFDREGRLGEVEFLDSAGDRVWRAQFDEYRDVGGSPFAHAITLDVAAGMTHAEVAFRKVELNPDLPADLFQLQEGGDPTEPDSPATRRK
jgi:hypothetical protein